MFAVEMKLMLSDGHQPDSMSQARGRRSPRVNTHLTTCHLPVNHLLPICVTDRQTHHDLSQTTTTTTTSATVTNAFQVHMGSQGESSGKVAQVLMGQMFFPSPNQQHQSTEANQLNLISHTTDQLRIVCPRLVTANKYSARQQTEIDPTYPFIPLSYDAHSYDEITRGQIQVTWITAHCDAA